MMDLFASVGEAPGTITHYVDADGGGGWIISESDDPASNYANTIRYQPYLSIETSVVLTDRPGGPGDPRGARLTSTVAGPFPRRPAMELGLGPPRPGDQARRVAPNVDSTAAITVERTPAISSSVRVRSWAWNRKVKARLRCRRAASRCGTRRRGAG